MRILYCLFGAKIYAAIAQGEKLSSTRVFAFVLMNTRTKEQEVHNYEPRLLLYRTSHFYRVIVDL